MPLTKERAEYRSEHIKKGSISYDFHVCVEAGTHYSAVTEICFDLVKVPAELPVDFKIQEIKKILVNDKPIEGFQKEGDDGFLYIKGENLKEGPNRIAVWYKNKYNNDGSGCVSFIDVDKKQYLYTQFEPYYANRVFPIFDQPDLKAKMRLDVICPEEWKKVLSNEHATVDLKPFDQEAYFSNIHTSHKDLLVEYCQTVNGCMTIFPETKLLPTYLYAFVAGAYEELKLEETYNVSICLFRESPCLSIASNP